MGLIKYKLGELIEQLSTRNQDVGNKFKAEDVRGISNQKDFIETKANLKGVSLQSYKVVQPDEFVYMTVTSRNGDKLSIAYNTSKDTYVVSSSYIVFRVKETNKLLSKYLFMYLNRNEFDRLARFNSWGSARETFSWEDFCDIEIELPLLSVQKKYVAVYEALLANQKAYEEGLEDLKLACNATIEEIKNKIEKVPMKKLVEEVDVRNTHMTVTSVSGVNIEKRFIPSKAKVTKKELKNYKLVEPRELVFSGMQTGRDRCIRIALNSTANYRAVSPAYNVLRVREEWTIPEYIMLWFSREESDRFGWFLSDSSIRANLDLERFFEIQIPLPDLLMQQSIANIFSVYTERKGINEKLKARLKNLCPILIKGAVEEASRKEI
jgi:type I restriction enzyme S subunit